MHNSNLHVILETEAKRVLHNLKENDMFVVIISLAVTIFFITRAVLAVRPVFAEGVEMTTRGMRSVNAALISIALTALIFMVVVPIAA